MTSGSTIDPPELASVERKGPKGAFKMNFTVLLSGASMWSICENDSTGPLPIFARRSKENFTEAASTDLPDAKLLPSASVKVHSLPSALDVQDLARSPSTSV